MHTEQEITLKELAHGTPQPRETDDGLPIERAPDFTIEIGPGELPPEHPFFDPSQRVPLQLPEEAIIFH